MTDKKQPDRGSDRGERIEKRDRKPTDYGQKESSNTVSFDRPTPPEKDKK